ncbi:ATP-dependent DNA helicase Q5 [Eumeta japonica]|uniref:ATP-dependent DNA helicase Q5 n=1 Tax=Eumeta variegata TaxID=151549 RepID=A0A4C1W2D3_EUMVA|nr:ATP-dependent DNA helicase Q5 [Eumeta japonica]
MMLAIKKLQPGKMSINAPMNSIKAIQKSPSRTSRKRKKACGNRRQSTNARNNRSNKRDRSTATHQDIENGQKPSRIAPQIDKNQPIEQAGFRPNYSTNDHIHAVDQLIEKYKEFNKPLYIGKETLSPKLFIAVLQDIFRNIDWADKGILVLNERLTHLRFADDIAMFSETATGLEQMFQNLASESNKVGLEMNTSKTKIMTNSIETPISIEGQNIEYVKEYIYLGKLTSFHSNRNKNEVDRRVNLAWRNYWAQKEILKGDYSLKMKKIIMDSCILPTLTYSRRDGQPAFCRIYYCRRERDAVDFLMRTEAGRAQTEERRRRASAARKSFAAMVRYCEEVRCRHAVFAEYFGETPPVCKARCDVCADSRRVQRMLDESARLEMNVRLGGGVAAADASSDGADLYGGGRRGQTRDTDEAYGDESEGETESDRRRVAAQTTALITEQLAARRRQTPAPAADAAVVKLSRCRAAASTTSKVNGLTVATRDSYLSLLTAALSAHAAERNDSGGTRAVERCARHLEYEAFSAVTVASLYRRAMAKLIASVKSCTDELYPPLETFMLKNDSEYDESEEHKGEMEGRATTPSRGERRKRNISSFKKDPLKQTKLAAYFTPTIKTVESETAPEAEPAQDDTIVINITLRGVSGDSSFKFTASEDKPRVKRKFRDLFGESSDSEPESTVLEPKLQNLSDGSGVYQGKKRARGRLKLESETKGGELQNTVNGDGAMHGPVDTITSVSEKHIGVSACADFAVGTTKGEESDASEGEEAGVAANEELGMSKREATGAVKGEKKKKKAVKCGEPGMAKDELAGRVVRLLMPYYKRRCITSRDLFKLTARQLVHRLLALRLTEEGAIKLLLKKTFRDVRISSPAAASALIAALRVP